MTPLAKIVLDAKPKPKPIVEEASPGDDGGPAIPILDGPKSGPIDVEYKSKMRATSRF